MVDWVPGTLRFMDGLAARSDWMEFARMMGREPTMKRLPSEYWAANCFAGASPPTAYRVRDALRVGRRQHDVRRRLPALREHLACHQGDGAGHARMDRRSRDGGTQDPDGEPGARCTGSTSRPWRRTSTASASSRRSSSNRPMPTRAAAGSASTAKVTHHSAPADRVVLRRRGTVGVTHSRPTKGGPMGALRLAWAMRTRLWSGW